MEMAAMWTWSELDEEQVRLLGEIEEELDGDIVVAYRPAEPGRDRPAELRMTPARLEASELRRIQEFERQVGCVAVAYEPE
jgi:hypothetical protein